jgi:hypothetical protein
MINYLGLPKLGSKLGAKPAESPQEDEVVRQAWDLYVARPTDAERADPKLTQRVADHDVAVARHRAENAYHRCASIFSACGTRWALWASRGCSTSGR